MKNCSLDEKNENLVVLVEAAKCIGCTKCELACRAAHYGMDIKAAAKLRKELEPRVHVVKKDKLKMPVQCRQCANAPCAAVCPTQALIQPDKQAGVIMREEYCAGCGICAMACPFGAITMTSAYFDEADQALLKPGDIPCRLAARCDQCAEWRAANNKDVTACQEACPTGVFSLVKISELRKLEKAAQPKKSAKAKSAKAKVD